VVGTIKEVSKILRNTPAVCRKCYVHPAVIEAFEAGELADQLPPSRRSGLKTDEAALAIFLQKDAKRRAREAVRGRKVQANGADQRLARLLTKSSQKAKAAALKNSSKDVKAEALATMTQAATPKTASKAARPATKKIARVRSPTAVAIG
jgi:DNA topoisomerase I